MFPDDLKDVAVWPHDLRMHTAALLAAARIAEGILRGKQSENAVLLRQVLDSFPADDCHVAPLRTLAAHVGTDWEVSKRAANAAVSTIFRRGLPRRPGSFGEYQVRKEALIAVPWIGIEANSCPVGWLPLLERAVAQIESCLDQNALWGVRTLQIKEKLGTLRWYLSGGEGPVRVSIRLAEATSEITCLVCGRPGVLRPDLLWILTLCDRHYAEASDTSSLSVSSRAYPQNASEFEVI